jgi:hypothetical protein
MEMLVGYEGQIIDGRPSIMENVVLPENAKIIVMVEMPQIKAETVAQTDKEKKAKAINALRGIVPPDVDFTLDDVRLERIKKRGLWND